jgi:NTP pyrophosphatase (non-canonical NTP hydrolase)
MLNIRKACRAALDHFDLASQLMKAAEECNELAVECFRWSQRRSSHAALASEIADVLIMCEQLTQIVGRDAVEDAVRSKLDRLASRIEKERAERIATVQAEAMQRATRCA